MSGAVVLLERVLHTVATAERTCSRLEADWERTRPVVEISIAWAFARLGAPRASMVQEALAALRAGDAVRRFIASVAEWRLRAPDAPAWPPDLDASFRRLDRFDRHHVGRTLQVMQTLEPWKEEDPFAAFLVAPVRAEPASQPDWRLRPTVPDLETRLRQYWTEERPIHQRLPALARVRVDRPADQATVERFVALFVEHWPRATDSFHTNAHWCLARIAFVDAVAFALAESVSPLPRPPSLDALR